jgi:hypothetical protein
VSGYFFNGAKAKMLKAKLKEWKKLNAEKAERKTK